MQYQFHQAVVLQGKFFFKVGVNEVSEELENDAHFLKFIDAGYISEVNSMPPNRFQSPKERAESLLNKLEEKAVKKTKAKK